MLSIFQMGCVLLLCLGVAGWWVACSLNRQNLEQQIEQTLDALDRASEYWMSKLADPTVSAYAESCILGLHVERGEVLRMQTALSTGEPLTVKQLVRLDKLVSEHLAESSALAMLSPVGNHGH